MLLMDIQARRGDVAEALQTFERLRVLLRDELGAAPSPAVLELHGRLLRHSPERRPAAAVRVPLPPIGAATDGRFVGRAAELRRLADGLARAGRGRWPVVFLTGEAGMGKTALAARFAAEVHAGGGTVLYGRCDEEPIGPYQPFVEALRQRIDCPGWDAVGELEPLGAVLPEAPRAACGEPPAVPGELQRDLLFDCVGRALGAWSEPSLLLILDDVHWADEPTAKLLATSRADAGPQRLMILATHRDEQREIAPTLANLFLELRKDDCLDRLTARRASTRARPWRWPSGCSTSRSRTSSPRALYQRTDGNPFFISEALHTLRASSLVAPGEAVSARALDQVGAPEGVQALIVPQPGQGLRDHGRRAVGGGRDRARVRCAGSSPRPSA